MSTKVHHPASYPNVTATIRLSGGHAEKPRTIAAYRAGQHVDMDVRSADGNFPSSAYGENQFKTQKFVHTVIIVHRSGWAVGVLYPLLDR